MTSAINYGGRASEPEVLSTQLTDGSPDEHPPFSSQVDSTFDDQYAMAKFSKFNIPIFL